jgi:hypothetical protein
MPFHLLFDKQRVSRWKERYYNYEESERNLKFAKILNEKVKEKQKKMDTTRSKYQKLHYKLEIDNLSKFFNNL